MAKIGAVVPLVTLEVPEGPERFCSRCGVLVGHRDPVLGVMGFVAFLKLFEGCGAWGTELFCPSDMPAEARAHARLEIK